VPHDHDDGDIVYTRAELRAIIRKQGSDEDQETPSKVVGEDNPGHAPHHGASAGSNLSIPGGSEVLSWLLGGGNLGNNGESRESGVTSMESIELQPVQALSTHDQAAPVISQAELKQINGALDLHRVVLGNLVITTRRQCLLASGCETAQDVLSRLHSGSKVVLLLHDGIEKRQGPVTAAMVQGILWPVDLLAGKALLRDIGCSTPVPLPDDISVLDALRRLEQRKSSSGLVVTSGDGGGGTVKGAVRAQDLLAALLCSKARENSGILTPSEERDTVAKIVKTSRIGRAGTQALMRSHTGSFNPTQPIATRVATPPMRGHYSALSGRHH